MLRIVNALKHRPNDAELWKIAAEYAETQAIHDFNIDSYANLTHVLAGNWKDSLYNYLRNQLDDNFEEICLNSNKLSSTLCKKKSGDLFGSILVPKLPPKSLNVIDCLDHWETLWKEGLYLDISNLPIDDIKAHAKTYQIISFMLNPKVASNPELLEDIKEYKIFIDCTKASVDEINSLYKMAEEHNIVGQLLDVCPIINGYRKIYDLSKIDNPKLMASILNKYQKSSVMKEVDRKDYILKGKRINANEYKKLTDQQKDGALRFEMIANSGNQLAFDWVLDMLEQEKTDLPEIYKDIIKRS